MLRIQNVISDIKLHPQQIAKRFFIEENVVKSNGIILEKPFKLQITAVAKVNGKKKKRVLNVEYNSTLKKAIADAVAKRNEWMDELKAEIVKGEVKKSVNAVTEMLTLSEAFERYVDASVTKKGDSFDEYRKRKLFEKTYPAYTG